MIRVAIGIDPGVAACGVGLLRRESGAWYAHVSATLRTNPKASLDQRLHSLHAMLHAQFRGHLIGVAPEETVFVIEEQEGALEGRRREGRTNADALLVQQAIGVIRTVAWSLSLAGRIVEVTPIDAKRVLVGMTRTSDKKQVQRAVRAIVRGCPGRMSQHASDAKAVALAGARRMP